MFFHKPVIVCYAAVLAGAVLIVAAAPIRTAAAAECKFEQCLVLLIDEAEVPAQEAGVLKTLLVKEGQQVTAGELLSQIDDAKTKMELKVAVAKLAVAKEKSADDINIRYSKASAEVAKADYLINREANDKVPGSVPAEALRERLMKYTESMLAIEKAKMEMRVAGHEADVAQAEVDAAEENLTRHQIRSPLNGLVVKLHRHAGEWVQQSDAVVHVIRMDRLWVEGFVNAAEFQPNTLRQRTARVDVLVAGGKTQSFAGKVVFVNPLIQAGGTFQVRVEIENREDDGAWQISPGLNAKMTILLQ